MNARVDQVMPKMAFCEGDDLAWLASVPVQEKRQTPTLDVSPGLGAWLKQSGLYRVPVVTAVHDFHRQNWADTSLMPHWKDKPCIVRCR